MVEYNSYTDPVMVDFVALHLNQQYSGGPGADAIV